MKKLRAVLIIILIAVMLCSCGKKNEQPSGGSTMSSSSGGTKNDNASDNPNGWMPDNPEPTEEVEEEIVLVTPTESDLRALNLDYDLQMPKDESYISVFEKLFLKDNAHLFEDTKFTTNREIGKVLKGDEVELVALEGDAACIICTIEGQKYAGWINRAYLRYNSPLNEAAPVSAETYTGTPKMRDIIKRGQEKSITLPLDSEFADIYDKMYVTTTKPLYATIEKNDKFSYCDIKSGSVVNVIAYRDKYALVIAMTDEGEKVGWLERELLRYDNPKGKVGIVSAEHLDGVPSVVDTESLGLAKSVTLPDYDSYICLYDRMFIAPTSTFVFSINENNRSFIEAQLVKGSEVNILALQGKYAFIKFETEMGPKVGWMYLADLSYNNPKNDIAPTSVEQHSGVPSYKCIEELGLQKSMTLPKDEDYICTFDRMFVTGSQVNIYSFEQSDSANVVCLLAKSSEVNVIAIHGKNVCVLYKCDEGTKCGWISIEALAYNNPKEDPHPVTAKSYSGVPSMKDIENLGLQKSMTLPLDEHFIACYDTMYVNASSLYVYSFMERKANIFIVPAGLYKGSEVTIIAINNDKACVLYETDMGTKCGWVSLAELSYNKPSVDHNPVKAKQYSGKPSENDIEDLGLEKSMTLPQNESYISCYEVMYTAIKDQQVYSFYEKERNLVVCSLKLGSEVTIIAIERNSACVLYETDLGTKCGWIALANLSYNDPNGKSEPTSVGILTGKPSYNDIQRLGLDKCVTLPLDEDYIASFDNMYIKISSMQLISFNDNGRSIVACTLPKGSEVSVMAIHGQKAFVMYESDCGTKCGWTVLEYLSYNSPLNSHGVVDASAPYGGKPGFSTISDLGLEKSMTLPDEDKYLDAYETMYIATNSPILSFNGRDGSVAACEVLKGSQVIVIAKQKGYACVLYETDQGTKAGWISETSLRSERPKVS